MHVIDSLAIGGAERMLVDIANQTAADGQSVSVCVTRSNAAADLRSGLHRDIPIHVLERKNRVEMAAFRKLARAVLKEQPHICQGHGRSTTAFLIAAKTLGLLRAKILMHDHYGLIETDESTPAWFRHWGRRLIWRYVGVCPKLGEWALRAGVDESKVRVIENAISLRSFGGGGDPTLRLRWAEPERLLGVVVAGFRPEKGIDVLLRAVAASPLCRQARILVVGGYRVRGYYEECCRVRQELKLEDTVLFIGERPDIADLLRCADFAVMPARSESGPLSLIEFMASEVPFVATLAGGISRRVANLGLPEFVEPNAAKPIAEALDRLLSLPRAALRQRALDGREIAHRHFDIQRQISQWYEVYDEIHLRAEMPA